MSGFRDFNTNGNESNDSVFWKIREMLTELFNGTVAALNVTALTLDSGTKTAAATTGAATLNKTAGRITSEALTTAAGAVYTLTLTNSNIAAGSLIFASVGDGTNTQGQCVVSAINAGSGSATIEIMNNHASQALNGTITIDYMVVS